MSGVNWDLETRLMVGRSVQADESSGPLADHSSRTFRKISLEIWTGKCVIPTHKAGCRGRIQVLGGEREAQSQ